MKEAVEETCWMRKHCCLCRYSSLFLCLRVITFVSVLLVILCFKLHYIFASLISFNIYTFSNEKVLLYIHGFLRKAVFYCTNSLTAEFFLLLLQTSCVVSLNLINADFHLSCEIFYWICVIKIQHIFTHFCTVLCR